MAVPPIRVRDRLFAPCLALAGALAAGCGERRDDRSARADLEKAKARISEAMDRIAAQDAASQVVVVIRSVGEEPEAVAQALADSRGLSVENARAFLTPGATSRPMAREEADALVASLTAAGAAAVIEPAAPDTSAPAPPPEPRS